MTHITIPRETVQQVLNTLNHVIQSDDDNDFMNLETSALVDDAITALLTALAAPAAQKEEPDALGLFHNQAHTDLGPATRLKAAPAAREPKS